MIVKHNELIRGDLVKMVTKDWSYRQCYFYYYKNKTNVDYCDLFSNRKIISTEDNLLFITNIKEYFHLNEYKARDVGLFLYKNKLLFTPFYFGIAYKILCVNKNRE